MTATLSNASEVFEEDSLLIEVDGSTVSITVEEVTPERAQVLLATNTNNRKANKDRISQLARNLRDNEFRFNGDSVRISSDGIMLDGQHRLYAIVQSGVSAPLLIVEGLRPDALQTIDQGKTRSVTDILTLKGARIKNITTVASIARHMILLGDAPNPNVLAKDRMYVGKFTEDNREGLETIGVRAVALIGLARNLGLVTTKSHSMPGVPIASTSVLGTLMYHMVEQGADADRVHEFFQRIFEGTPDPDCKHVFLAARTRLCTTAPLSSPSNKPRYLLANYEVFIRAYNAWRTGKDAQRLQEPKNIPTRLGELTKPVQG